MIMRTFLKLDEMPSAWLPSRKSEAMATHSLPTMAITEPPLYSIIDCNEKVNADHARAGQSCIPCWAIVSVRSRSVEGVGEGT